MRKLFLLSLLLTGCASFSYQVVGWYNDDSDVLNSKILFSNGKVATVVGNPHITCYTNKGFKLADGYFVTVQNDKLQVDEFGKQFVWVEDNKGNYCMFDEGVK